ncbi:3-oxoacyl-ACP reductase [Kitasatospora sp. MMS16-BH015]|uniref:SDR family NAD(P)-dependent oxidoreductase n=1 Tax=Kitasatospora sp. MMS16-BH015 TaxID=2018025 RepID=UPI000CA32426|nr:SDR family oxidoreductase [Kitasatospora sp. MMS16-BH015]AUG78955.1 3-oxoacyl-ACP reductase [Kitasatospora sp. MMS16-BH015]
MSTAQLEHPTEAPLAEPQEAAPVRDDRRVAVISGGSRGLGRVLAEKLLADDWRVATFSRSANEFTAKTADYDPESFFWEAADLSDPQSMRAFVRQVSKRFGRIDLLVNNAGVLHQELFLTTTPRNIESLVTNNLIAPITLTQACARLMVRSGGGNVVNISSINAIRGYRGVAVYAAAKAGLDGFSRSLARELGAFNIRVNSLVPGFFDSDMTAEVTERNRDRIQHRTPLGRLGTVDEIADAVLFLTSPRAQFVTGQSLVIDGGITC